MRSCVRSGQAVAGSRTANARPTPLLKMSVMTTQCNDREQQHIGLLGREIRRRATALTATARALR